MRPVGEILLLNALVVEGLGHSYMPNVGIDEGVSDGP